MKQPPSLAVFDKESRGGHGMIYFEGCDVVTPCLVRPTDAQTNKAKHRAVKGGDDREVRPDGAVQEMLLDRPKNRRGAEDLDLTLNISHIEVIGEKENPSHVVKMGVSDENTLHVLLGFPAQGRSDTLGVEEDIVVEKKTGKVVPWKLRTGTPLIFIPAKLLMNPPSLNLAFLTYL